MKKFGLPIIVIFFLVGLLVGIAGFVTIFMLPLITSLGGQGGSSGPTLTFNGLSDVGGSSYTTSGGTVDERVQRIRGSTPDLGSNYVKYSLNGASYYLEIESDGSFDQEILLSPGTNTLILYIYSSSGALLWTSQTYTYTANIETTAIRVVLSWDTEDTDVDLHIWDPNGNHAYYSEMEAIPYGELDIDDTDGYGPETFTLTDAVPGIYTIKVRYYSNHGNYDDTHATVVLTINEGIPVTYGPHTFTSDMANGDDSSNDWTVATFSVTS